MWWYENYIPLKGKKSKEIWALNQRIRIGVNWLGISIRKVGALIGIFGK